MTSNCLSSPGRKPTEFGVLEIIANLSVRMIDRQRTRIRFHRNRLGVSLAINCKPNRVIPGLQSPGTPLSTHPRSRRRRGRTSRRRTSISSRRRTSRTFPKPRRSYVQRHTMHAGLRRRRRRRFLPDSLHIDRLRINGANRRIARSTRPNTPFAVDQLNLHRLAWRILQPVVGHNSGWRVEFLRLLMRQRSSVHAPGTNRKRLPGLKQICTGGPDLFPLRRNLPQRRHLVHHPEATAMRRNSKVIAMDNNVAHTRDRHVVLQRLPMLSVVKRNINAKLSSRIKKPLRLRVLLYGVHISPLRNTGNDILPALATVMRPKNIRLVVRDAMPVNRRVSRLYIKMPCLNLRDLAPRRHRRWRHILPALPVVARHVN